MSMTSRERFRMALNFQEPDRVPIDVGQDLHNGLHEVAYRNLLEYLNEKDDIVIYDQMQHLVKVKESILNRLHADTRYVFANSPEGFAIRFAEDGSWLDEWGVRRKTVGYYDENISSPLAGCDLDSVKNFRLPDPCDPTRFRGLRERALKLRDETDFAIIGGNAASLFFLSSEIVGFQEYMEMLLTDSEVIELLLDRILEWQIAFFDHYLNAVGDIVEMIWMGDDWGTQIAPIINPKMFRDLFVTRYKKFTDFVKTKTKAKIALHSCGAIQWALNDLAESGVDVIHPLQGDAQGLLDPESIKREFGGKLIFYSNLKNQTVIPHGTPEQVAEDVRRKIKVFAPGGGYIISGGHNIQADVPPQNVLALFDTAYEYGTYPIK